MKKILFLFLLLFLNLNIIAQGVIKNTINETELEKIKKAFANIKTEEQLLELVPFQKGNLFGYMQYGTKKILVKPMFTNADFYRYRIKNNAFSTTKTSNYLKVEVDSNIIYIKPNNEITSDKKIEKIGYGTSYSEKDKNIANKKGLGFISKGDIIISYSQDYESCEALKINNQLCAKVKYKGLYGIVDVFGNPIATNFAIKYLSLRVITDFIFFVQNENDKKWSIITNKGDFFLQGLDDTPLYSDRYYVIKLQGKWGVIDLEGKQIIAQKYSDAQKYIDVKQSANGTKRYFFQFKLKKNFFYVDENGIEYCR